MKNVEWGHYKLGDLFDSANGDFDIQKKHINGKGNFVITAGLTNNGILGKTDVKSKLFSKNTITIDMFGAAFYRQVNYKMVTHARVFALLPKFEITYYQGLFLANSLHFLPSKFGYENMCSWNKIQGLKIQLPTKNGKIDFDFMASFVAEIENERILKLENYISEISLRDYQLTKQEIQALENYENLSWSIFNLENLFGKSTRGRRLKSADRISGDLPFIKAGETDEGVSAFIGNDVKVFSDNTTTIDMFGSAKYRNFKYGGDDHIAVVHTDKLPKYASVFVTSAIHKSSYNGQFNYGRNFYAKDADALDISLPVKDGKPDYEIMETVISAIHKLVIKDVVLYVERKKKELNKLTENANA